MNDKKSAGITGELLSSPAANYFNIKNLYPYWPKINIEEGTRKINETTQVGFLSFGTAVRVVHDGTWYVSLVRFDHEIVSEAYQPNRLLQDFIEKVYHTQLLFNPAAIHELKNMDGDSVWVKDHLQISELERITNQILRNSSTGNKKANGEDKI